jgi:hypothetical protein
MAINLTIFAGDISQVLLSFDVLRVERSTTGDTGPYSEITAPAATAATLVGPNAGSFNLVGLTLEVKVDNDATVLITFTGVNPLTTTQVVDQVNTALGASIATDDANRLRLTSTITGTASKMEIIGGTALAVFGFTAGDRDIGEEPYITLVAGQENYAFTDNDGEAGYFYRSWFHNTVNNQDSQRSAPFEGVPGTQVTSGTLSLATIDLVDLSGRALPDRAITVYPVSIPLTVEGYGVDLGRAGITVLTDNSGHAELSLIRGARVKVVFEGTQFIRTIDVPDQSTFDLLVAVSAEDDQFTKAVILNIPAAPRRTL